MSSCARRKSPLHPFLSILSSLFAALGIALLLLHSPAAMAQTSASITGSVTDSSGAAVSGADITVRNVNTGLERLAVTDHSGSYQVLSLPIGSYQILISKPGFAKEVRQGIHLAVGQVATVDLILRARPSTTAGDSRRGCVRCEPERRRSIRTGRRATDKRPSSQWAQL